MLCTDLPPRKRAPGTFNMQRLARLKREVEMLRDSPPHGITCYPVEENITKFEASTLTNFANDKKKYGSKIMTVMEKFAVEIE